MVFRILIFLLAIHCTTQAQNKVSENVVIVTLDGLRWQEVFGGADSLLTFDTTSNYGYRYVQKHFWAPNAEKRRNILMPFFWTELASKGILLGNREIGSFVNNANPHRFSYPGYNEIFTGFPDPLVNSNDKLYNKNENVLEHLNKMPKFKGRIAAFGSWDVFAYILNDKRSGIYVNDGFRDLDGKLTDKQVLLNNLQHQSPDLFHGGERLDVYTFYLGMEYMKMKKPRIMYFAFGDTDEFAHSGEYDFYLDAARKTDKWIGMLWEYIQSTPGYAGKTTMIITTDHGRGSATEGNWKHHGEKVAGADEIWMAAIGPSIPAEGEARNGEQLYQGQIAATIAAFLGASFQPKHKTLEAIKKFTP